MALPATPSANKYLLYRREAEETAVAIADSLPRDREHAHDAEHEVHKGDLLRIGFVALAAAAVWFRIWEPVPSFSGGSCGCLWRCRRPALVRGEFIGSTGFPLSFGSASS